MKDGDLKQKGNLLAGVFNCHPLRAVKREHELLQNFKPAPNVSALKIFVC